MTVLHATFTAAAPPGSLTLHAEFTATDPAPPGQVTLHATFTAFAPPPFFMVKKGGTLRRARLGMKVGGTIAWLTPEL